MAPSTRDKPLHCNPAAWEGLGGHPYRRGAPGLVLSCLLLLTLYTAVMSFEILFPFGLWVFEPDWLLNHSQLV